MRESFIFHFDYIEDIPEELQPGYAMAVIRYARYGEEPQYDDWRDQRMWNRIRERMDEETAKYERKCRNLRHQAAEDEPEVEPEEVEALEGYTNNAGEEKPKRPRFKKPTVEEVRKYCQERGNGIDAQHFCDFYESKGWKIGKSSMKDWKAAVRNWETRQRTAPATTKQLPDDRLTL